MPQADWIEPPRECAWVSDRFPDSLVQAVLARRFPTEQAALAFLDDTPFQPPAEESLPNMAAAVQRISAALRGGERIAIFGDYDVDGVAATAILTKVLQQSSGNAASLRVRLPSRADGYGLRPDGVREAATSGATLLIAVDCGSSDAENVGLARSLGLDVVVLDHHQLVGAPVPAIVVSPQLATDDRFRHLSAAGVVYLFALALADAGYDLGEGPGRAPTHLLDLVSLGLIADVMPLTGAVRSLVRDGLARLHEWGRPGIRSVALRAGLSLDRVTSEDVSFKLAPRLNAAGRMDDPRLALGLLLTEDPARADQRATRLEQLNALRKTETNRVAAAARAEINANPELARRRVVVVHGPDWHAGIVGIVAAKLADELGRPAIVLSDADGVSRGSARSVAGFDIGRAIEACADLLIAHGGHDQAAGLTIETALLPALTASLEASAVKADLPPVSGVVHEIDADLPLERLDLTTVAALSVLEPFGSGNPRPLFRVRGARLNSYRGIGQDGRHLKLFIATPRGEVGVVAWNTGHRSRELVGQRHLDLLLTLGEDRWNGQRRLEAVLTDFRIPR